MLYLFSILLGYVEVLLQLWLYRYSSASFQLVSCENFSTRRCIFDVFKGGGDLHILLFCHLVPTLFVCFASLMNVSVE